jgi:hypothetical protein
MSKLCFLAKVAAAATLYLFSMPSPAAAELSAREADGTRLAAPVPNVRAMRAAPRSARPHASVNHAAGKTRARCRDRLESRPSAGPDGLQRQ